MTVGKGVAGRGEVPLVLYPSRGLHGAYPIRSDGGLKFKAPAAVAIFTSSIHCHTVVIVIFEVTTSNVHICIIVVLFFSVRRMITTNTGLAFDNHFSGRRIAITWLRKLKNSGRRYNNLHIFA